MWRKGEKLRVDGTKVYVDHVFEDGSASIRDLRTGLLKGKIPAKITSPEAATPSPPQNIDFSTPNLNHAGLSVKNYQRLLEAQEIYETKTENYYTVLENGEGDVKKAEKEMTESLEKLKTIEKEIFA